MKNLVETFDELDRSATEARRQLIEARSALLRRNARIFWTRVGAALSLLAIIIWCSSCANMFAATTKASYIVVKPDGTRIEAHYESGKQQDGFSAVMPDNVRIQTEKATTPESVAAASLAAQAQLLKLIDALSARIPVAP